MPHLHRQEWPEEEGDATAVSHKCRRAGLGQNVHHSAGEVGRRRRSAAHAVDVEAQQLVAPPWSTVPLTQHTMKNSNRKNSARLLRGLRSDECFFFLTIQHAPLPLPFAR